MIIPTFHKKEDLFKFLKENKQDLIAAKKNGGNKEADAISYNVPITCDKGIAVKAENIEAIDLSVIKAIVVINTTNLLDSHGDVHIPGIWNKSVKEIKNVYLLQEHKMQFDKIITSKVKASVKNYSWSELGYPEFKGETQALVFDAEINCERNKFMFEQYLKGYVSQHSVGMQYVNMFLCVDSTEKYYVEEKENFDKYIVQVANKQDAIDAGYFWAVTEAKIIEGSAVVRGSNYATPTISITNTEAGKSTAEEIEPLNSTQKSINNLNYLANNLNLK